MALRKECFCVEEAAHGIELTKVKSENFYVSCNMGLGLECCDVLASQAQNKITG